MRQHDWVETYHGNYQCTFQMHMGKSWLSYFVPCNILSGTLPTCCGLTIVFHLTLPPWGSVMVPAIMDWMHGNSDSNKPIFLYMVSVGYSEQEMENWGRTNKRLWWKWRMILIKNFSFKRNIIKKSVIKLPQKVNKINI